MNFQKGTLDALTDPSSRVRHHQETHIYSPIKPSNPRI
jgi:hypothetical protein